MFEDLMVIFIGIGIIIFAYLKFIVINNKWIVD